MSRSLFRRRVVVALLVCGALVGCALSHSRAVESKAQQAPKPHQPQQPSSGPGSAIYPHADITMHVYGNGATEYWIFEPAGPTPRTAPVVIFSHGWSAMNPRSYGAWISHLVRRGNIVIFPRYQETNRTRMTQFTPNAVTSVKAAFEELKQPGHVQPDLTRVAATGHSMGGALSANLAALAHQEGFPQPKAVMCVEPGHRVRGAYKVQMPLADLRQIPASTLLLTLAGDDDQVVGDDTCNEICTQTPQIPKTNKNFLVLQTDSHGTPPIKGTHFAPLALDERFTRQLSRYLPVETLEETLVGAGERFLMTVDAADYYGVWKLFDGLTDAAFYGKHRECCLGNTPQQRFMGIWSDGVPVKELQVRSLP